MNNEMQSNQFPDALVSSLQNIRSALDTEISVVNTGIGNFEPNVRMAAEERLRDLELKRNDIDFFLQTGSRLEGTELMSSINNLTQSLKDLNDIQTGILTRLEKFFNEFLNDYTTANELRTLSEEIQVFIEEIQKLAM